LVSYQSDNSNLVEEDVIIEWLVINYAMKDRNPMDSVRFFSKQHQHQGTIGQQSKWIIPSTYSFKILMFLCFLGSFTIPKQQVSSLVPSQFQEINIRVFARNPENSTKIRKAFYRMMKTYDSNKQLKPDLDSWMTARQNLWETESM
jgi:hypothetical protein